MRNYGRTLIALAASLVAACASPEPQGPADEPGGGEATVSFLSVAPGIATLAVTITGPGIDVPLVFNLTIDSVTNVASGTISVPAGSNRRIVANAFDSAGVNTHRGETTVSLVQGNNPAVTLTLIPLLGDLPIEILVGSAVLVLTPETTTANVGDTVTFTFAATSGQGVITTGQTWGIGNTAVARYVGGGRVLAQVPGVTTVTVNTPFGSVQSTLTVFGTLTGTVLYEFDPGNSPQMYRMLPNGSGAERVPTGLANDIHATWGPGNVMLAFSSWPGAFDMFVMNADGSGRINVASAGPNYTPHISPDGARIVWDRQLGSGDADHEIFTMNADGSGVTRVTNNGSRDSWPRWSPDGTRIFFDSKRDGDDEIYAMDADGSNPVRLTDTLGSNFRPIPSPDGTKILFTSTRDGNAEVYVSNSDGSNPRRITNDAAEDVAAGWSPDGTYILFNSLRAGNPDIYVALLAGGTPRPLTSSPASEAANDWR